MLRLVGTLAIYLIIGAPIAFYVWDTLSNLLAGQFAAVQVGISLLLLAVFWFVAVRLARFVQATAEPNA